MASVLRLGFCPLTLPPPHEEQRVTADVSAPRLSRSRLAARKPDSEKVCASARIAAVSREFQSRGTARRAVNGLSVRPTLAEVPLTGLSFAQLIKIFSAQHEIIYWNGFDAPYFL